MNYITDKELVAIAEHMDRHISLSERLDTIKTMYHELCGNVQSCGNLVYNGVEFSIDELCKQKSWVTMAMYITRITDCEVYEAMVFLKCVEEWICCGDKWYKYTDSRFIQLMYGVDYTSAFPDITYAKIPHEYVYCGKAYSYDDTLECLPPEERRHSDKYMAAYASSVRRGELFGNVENEMFNHYGSHEKVDEVVEKIGVHKCNLGFWRDEE